VHDLIRALREEPLNASWRRVNHRTPTATARGRTM